MALVTRCPNCQTAFKVNDAQLAAHRGKVRCGKCAFVFNALDCIERERPVAPVDEPTPQPAQSQAPQHALAPQAPPAPVVTPVAAPVPAAPTPSVFAAPAPKPERPAPPPETPAPAPTPVATPIVAVPPPAEPEAEHPATPAPALPAHEPEIAAEAVMPDEVEVAHPIELEAPVALASVAMEEPAAEPTASPVATESEPVAAIAEDNADEIIELNANTENWGNNDAQHARHEPIYQPIRTAEDDALLELPKPRSPWRWAWLPLIALALFALLVQVGYTYRTMLSTELPWLRPHYQRICARLGCDLPLPRNADLLRPDYSELTFVPGHGDLIQVTASVRNLAEYEQALPMLELTLTDDHDQVVAKKVFSARDYLVPTEAHRTQFPAGDEVHAYLQLDVGELKSTGYSLYWFYP